MSTYHKNQRGFFSALIGLIFILLCIMGLYYLLFYKKTEEYVAKNPQDQVASTTPNVELANGMTTYVSKVEADFEEHEVQSFQFSYPNDTFSVSGSTDGKKVLILEKQSGNSGTSTATTTLHTLTISYEGGRGYSPNDYWTNIAKKSCANCVKIDPPFSIVNATSTLAYQNEQKIIHIVSSPNKSWLFVFELKRPGDNAVNALRSFSFE